MDGRKESEVRWKEGFNNNKNNGLKPNNEKWKKKNNKAKQNKKQYTHTHHISFLLSWISSKWNAMNTNFLSPLKWLRRRRRRWHRWRKGQQMRTLYSIAQWVMERARTHLFSCVQYINCMSRVIRTYVQRNNINVDNNNNNTSAHKNKTKKIMSRNISLDFISEEKCRAKFVPSVCRNLF